MKTALALAAGALMLVWPALLNRYPLVFSDTGGLLAMALEPEMGWDKPWVYGPFLLVLHGRTTLWGPVLAQGLLLSHLLWLAQKVVLPPPGRARHLALCAGLAAATAAPWFAALLMPDIFAPMVVLCTALLGFGRARLTRWERVWITAIGVLAVAVHLAHLVLAAGCLLAVWLLHLGPLGRALHPRRLRGRVGGRVWRRVWGRLWRPAVPLAGALGVLLLSNAFGHGVPGISPYGSVFMLARLVADGPARDLIERECPAAGYERMCAWKGRLPTDSDAFLWDEDGPVWGNGRGPIAFAPEASRVVRDTVLADPGAVAAAMAANTWRQLWRVRVGDALIPEHLDENVRVRLSAHFPPDEVARYDASMQRAGGLPGVAARFAPLHGAVLVLGALGSLFVLVWYRRRDRVLSAFAGVVLAGLAANALATGALSGPHDRYQARIAWLVVLPPAFAAMRPRYAAGRATSSGVMRTRAS